MPTDHLERAVRPRRPTQPVRRLIIEKYRTLSAFARALECDGEQVARICSGRQVPRVDRAMRMARLLNVPVEELFHYEDERAR